MMRRLLRFLPPLLGPALLVVWLHFADTYSMLRDAVGIGLVAIAMVAVSSCERRRLAHGKGFSWWITRSFVPAWRLGPTLVWALLCWVVLGSLDQMFESTPGPRNGMNVQVAPEYRSLRVGLALSGGGYRAALVHAGVLNILARRGVLVTNLSTVSGGSIIGSFIAAGGNPRDFKDGLALQLEGLNRLADRVAVSGGFRPATRVLSTVTSVASTLDISMAYEGQKSGRASLQMTFGGYTVVPESDWPKMYRVRRPDGSLTDMVNLTRARDAARALAGQ